MSEFGRNSRRPSLRGGGFTLIETAMATSIIGVAVVAILQFIAAGTRTSSDALNLTTAMHLAQDFREHTVVMTTAQLDAMRGRSFSPPIDARGVPIAGMGDWRQDIAVEGADLNRLTLSVPITSSPIRRVVVTVSRNGEQVLSMRWLVCE